MRLLPFFVTTLIALSDACSCSFALEQNDAPPHLFAEAYAGQISHKPGDNLEIHGSTSAKTISVEISRLGASREVVLSRNDVSGISSPIPENASSHGCQWPILLKTTIPENWKSGYYEVRVKATDSGGKYTFRGNRTAESTCHFVLRSAKPGKDTSVLIQLSTNTYNAYNNWGGLSLYSYNGRAAAQGSRVSMDRPPQSQFSNWELPFCAWAESNGWTVDYAANSDLEFHSELLDSYRLVLSVGHDEYWSAPMRDNLERFIKQGGNVAFLSGNTCCWQVRSEDQGRAIVCWKQRFSMDPVFPSKDRSLLSTLWSHHLVARPENQLTGVGFLFGGYHRSHGQLMDGAGAYTIHRPDHWLFEGTGLQRGDELGRKDTIVGYECDGCELKWIDGLPEPTHSDGTPEGFTVLATAPAKWHPDDAYFYDRFEHDRMGASVLGVYSRGGTVVTVGSTDWAHGLKGKDAAVEQITRNILTRLSVPPRVQQPK